MLYIEEALDLSKTMATTRDTVCVKPFREKCLLNSFKCMDGKKWLSKFYRNDRKGSLKGPVQGQGFTGMLGMGRMCKQTIHEPQAARKHWESDGSQLLCIPSSTRFGRSFVYLRTSCCLVVAILISDYQKLPIAGKQGIFAVAKQ